MEVIQKHVRNLEIGEIQKYRNLAIAPILGKDSNLEHVVLADALRSGMEIREKGSGNVPTLFAINRTGKNVLAIAGEYVVGGMQNRTIVKNIYFDKQFEGEIPVRCVQRGRWNYGAQDIRPDYFPVPSRRPKREPATVFRHGGHAPLMACLAAKSQHETWSAVEEVLCCADVRSASSDLHAVLEERQEDLNKYKENFPLVNRQVGNIAVIGKNGQKIFVLDLFDRANILGKYHNNLVESYALEAGLRGNGGVEVNEREVRGFLDSVDACDFQKQEPVSVGEDYKIAGANLQGSTLLFNNNLVYMNFFSRNQNGTSGNPDMREESIENSSLRTGFYRCF